MQARADFRDTADIRERTRHSNRRDRRSVLLSVGEIAAIDNRMRDSQRSVLQVLAHAPNCVEYLLERLVPDGETPRIREINAEAFDPATHLSDVLAWAAGVRTDLPRLRYADVSRPRQRALHRMTQAMGRARLFVADFDAVVSYALNNWPLRSENRDEYLATIREGHREHLTYTRQWLQGNIGLARAVAMKYRHRGLELDDLVQEGCVGLLRAIDRFEVARGWRFSTYAMWWVRHFIERAIQGQASLIRLPRHTATGMQASRASLCAQDGFAKIPALTGQTHVSVDAYESVALLAVEPAANKCDGGSCETAFDFVESKSPTPEETVIESDLRRHLRRLLNRLPLREAEVLTLLYGLTGEEMNLREVGDRLGISGERVRQLREAAVKRLAEYFRQEH